jgi:hypothetical protein
MKAAEILHENQFIIGSGDFFGKNAGTAAPPFGVVVPGHNGGGGFGY